MAMSALPFRTKKEKSTVPFPLFGLVSDIGTSVTFFCHCRMTSLGQAKFSSDPIVLAVLLSFLCVVVIYSINHHYFRRRAIGTESDGRVFVLAKGTVYIDRILDFASTRISRTGVAQRNYLSKFPIQDL